MPDSVDAFCDQFQVNIGPFGATINFNVTGPNPPAPGTVPPATRVATLRMNLEHLKMMAFILRKQVMAYEQAMGVQVQVPPQVLNMSQIGHEDWEGFWRAPER